MNVDLKEFRDRMHFTQAEMAEQLGMKSSSYAMLERGNRKPTPEVDLAVKRLQEKFSFPSSGQRQESVTVSADVIALINNTQFTAENMLEQSAYRTIKIFALLKKLKQMKLQFNKAYALVTGTDLQLQEAGGDPKKKEMMMLLNGKRIKAMKIMEAIVAQSPPRLILKIEMLKQEKIILENAAKAGGIKWLDDSGEG